MGTRWDWGVVVLGLLCGCTSSLGDGPDGFSVRGTVTYDGDLARDFENPILLVTADITLEQGENVRPPYALFSATDIDLDEPLDFELNYLLPGRYYLVALIGERDEFDGAASPLGSFPNACVLAMMPDSRSIEVDDQNLEDVDITIYDALTDDPCFATPPADGGTGDSGPPPEGTGILEANISATGITPQAGDTLSVTLFDVSPLMGGEPTYTETLEDVSFPATVTVNDVDAGDYTVIVCFQDADSTNEQCMGPDDSLAFFPSLTETVDVNDGETTTVDVELN